MILPTSYRVTCHTDHVGPGSTFVAIPGSNNNGISYIAQAVERGATTIVVPTGTTLDQDIIDRCNPNITLTYVDNPRLALAQLSAQAYNHPARKLKIIGVTGTKGKTTSVYLLHHILQQAGHATAMFTGIENKIGTQSFPAELTTPHPDYMHMFFEQCVVQGVEYVVMEASAQGFSLHRLEGINFDAMIFTNFSLEHSEFYPNIEEYFEAKCEIFQHCKATAPRIVNADDPWIKKIISAYDNLTRVGFSSGFDMVGTINTADMSFLSFTINQEHTLQSSTMVGPYNATNVLGVFACLYALNIPTNQIIPAIANFSHVPGRLERFKLDNGVTAVIDYAHNPSSFQALFSMLKSNTNDLSVVFGCGGSRDKSKRPMMGELAARYCSKIYLTSDNPRTENPQQIVQDIMLGIPANMQPAVVIEPDRAQAIVRALQNARPGGIVAILGKGPDEYQLVGTTKTFFSDKQEIQKFTSFCNSRPA